MAILFDGKGIAADEKAAVAEKCAMLKETPMANNLRTLNITKDVLVQNLSHVRRFQRVCSLLCWNIGERLFTNRRGVRTFGTGGQIHGIALRQFMCFELSLFGTFVVPPASVP